MTKLHQKCEIYKTPYGENRLNFPISIVQGNQTENLKVLSFKEFLNEIQDVKHIPKHNELLEAYSKGKAIYTPIKEKLNSFVIGDWYYRNDESCKVYVPIIGFDIDGFPDILQTEFAISELEKCEYIFCVFPSPSSHGLRILVWCDSTPDTHKAVNVAFFDVLEKLMNIGKKKKDHEPNIDTSTGNLSRKWFYSYVPKDLIYLNLESKVFVPSAESLIKKEVVRIEKRPPNTLDTQISIDNNTIIAICEQHAQSRNIQSGRNNYIYFLANDLNEHGLEAELVLSHCLTYTESDFTEAEIKKIVGSALKNSKHAKYEPKQIAAYLRNNPAVETETINYTTQNNPAVETKTHAPKNGTLPKISLIENFLDERYDVRYNIVANDVEISVIGKNKFETVNEDQLICEILRTGLNGVEKPLLSLLKSKYPKQYHPFKEYFETVNKTYNWKQGDFDHIEFLASHVKAKDNYFFKMQFKKMLVRVVACAIGKIPFNKQCLTLFGKQNDGKTTFIRFLCPPELAFYIKENLDIDKDGRIALCQNLIINLDELAGISKKDINSIKNYLTADHAKERPPYGKKPVRFKRTASFFASTNNGDFLTDETGNVRWLIFEIQGFDFQYTYKVDINAVWSQAYALFKSGFKYEMTPDEITYSEKNNTQFKRTYVEFELIQKMFISASKETPGAIFMTATEIKEELEIGHVNRKLSLTAVSNALKGLCFERCSQYKTTLKNSFYGYYTLKQD